MTPKAKILPGRNGLQELIMQGLFPHPHWMVFVLAGLSEKQVSVVEGRATQQITHIWDAHFQLDFRRSGLTPETIDYLALSTLKPASNLATRLQLSTFELRRRPDRALEIIVQGPDQLGFLGKLLGEVSLLALYPTELEINTISGQIKDRLVFRGIGGAAPSENIESSLQTLLCNFQE
jgi:hypothetical protein